ncbi:hypothetical protein RBB50_009362 [Rhinocladiella similis]
MRPVENELFGLPKEERDNRAPAGTDNPSMPSSRIRGMHSEDSWIEISSRPSSSSLSSTSNDIITTGLEIRPQDERLSRQRHTSTHLTTSQPRAASTAGSSQDEYEESESDSDRVLSSSNEDISQDEAADDDDTSTALGVGTMDKPFTPQPNAFSHPPSSQQGTIPDSYFPPVPASAEARPSNERTITQRSYQRQIQSRQRTYTSSYQPDHDAALRASLTTLLSCAAAVRPKGPEPRPAAPSTRPSAQPTSLRLVAESEIDGQSRPRPKRTSSPKQTKRKSRESSKERHSKKVRPTKAAVSGEDLISPTLASWMISAGVVLVFSAISFSAGYAWGREVGRIEGEMGFTGGGNCSREAMRGTGSGLRRLRWTSAAAASSISA